MSGRSFFATVSMVSLAALLPHQASAAVVRESEPNNTLATADNVDGHFTTDFVRRIEDANGVNTSTTIPHVGFRGRGQANRDGGIYSDYFSFTVPVAGTRGIFDVDSNSLTSNTELYLYDAAGNLLAENDDATRIDRGSRTLFDPFLAYTFSSAGLYVVGIGGLASIGSLGGITGPGLLPTDTYVVNASLNAVPEPISFVLFGAGVAGLITYRRRKRPPVADAQAA